MKKMVWTCEGSHGGRLSQCVNSVSQSIGQLRSVDEYNYLLNLGFTRTRSQILCN